MSDSSFEAVADTSSAIKDESSSSSSSPPPLKSPKLDLSSGSPPPPNNVPLSKNQLKKQRRLEKAKITRVFRRQKERDDRKRKKLYKRVGKDDKLAIAEKLRKAFDSAPKVVIDCRYDEHMNLKEKKRLAQQLRRVYSSNKASDSPLHLIFSSMPENGEFFDICCKQNDGFPTYTVDRRDEEVKDLFPCDKLVYLSPDSPNVLTEFNPEKVYCIGGLVDETISKNISLNFSNTNNIVTARLPIDEHFVAEKESGTGTLKKILAINQVFDIILEWYTTKDWVKAISAGLPERTGFKPRVLL